VIWEKIVSWDVTNVIDNVNGREMKEENSLNMNQV
jgi:hypothetical protein